MQVVEKAALAAMHTAVESGRDVGDDADQD